MQSPHQLESFKRKNGHFNMLKSRSPHLNKASAGDGYIYIFWVASFGLGYLVVCKRSHASIITKVYIVFDFCIYKIQFYIKSNTINLGIPRIPAIRMVMFQ